MPAQRVSTLTFNQKQNVIKQSSAAAKWRRKFQDGMKPDNSEILKRQKLLWGFQQLRRYIEKRSMLRSSYKYKKVYRLP